MITACLAAILGHYIETTFGFEISSTQTFFWLFTAVFVIIGLNLACHESAESNNTDSPLITNNLEPNREKNAHDPISSSWLSIKQETFYAGIILAILLTTVGYSFLVNINESTNAWAILVNAMVRISRNIHTYSYAMLSAFFITLVIRMVVMVRNDQTADQGLRKCTSFFKMLPVLAIFCVPYWVWRSFDLANQVIPSSVNINGALNTLFNADGQIVTYSIYIFFLIMILSIVLFVRKDHLHSRSKQISIVLLPVTLLLVIFFAYILNIKPIQADIAFHNGQMAFLNQDWSLAVPLMDRARQLAPHEDYYAINFANTMVQQAGASSEDAAQFNLLMTEAEKNLVETRQKKPVDSLPVISLADLYAQWARQSHIPSESEYHGKQADALYSEALTLSPADDRLWFKQALLNVNIFNQNDLARQQLKNALESNPLSENAHGLSGYINLQQALISCPGSERDLLLENAADNYERAIIIAGNKFDYLIPLATAYTALGHYNKAYHGFESALPLATSETRWQVNYSLSQTSMDLGNRTAAIKFAKKALVEAPSAAQNDISQFISKIIPNP